MHQAIIWLPLLVHVALLPSSSLAYLSYQSQLPNGNRVPSPCSAGGLWPGVGHQSSLGANTRNPFGLDFTIAGRKWTPELCRKDSDGDGMTNGQELGDPDCVWTLGATPARTTGLSHPGICPLDSKTCTNTWDVCPKVFNCPAFNEANVTVRNFTVNQNTPVPAKETTYMCQAFELNTTAEAVHMIGSRPIIVNKDVMHHILLYACSVRPNQKYFDAPQDCFMGMSDCTEIINLWGVGIDGECFNSNAGFRIGGAGFRYAIMQLHWNNPKKLTTLTDSSGLALYFTTKLRPYDQGTLMYGEMNLVLPPRQPLISFNHTCPSVCTNKFHKETRNITSALLHMHVYGTKGRISLWRNGALFKDLSPLQVYDYNSPQMIQFDPPIEYRQGDEIKTECYFSTLRSNSSIFWGEGTGDEMCFAFLSYYPNNVSAKSDEKLGQCLAVAGMNLCWMSSGVTPQIEQGCNITGLMSGSIPNQVFSDMSANRCFSRTGCDPACRDYLNTLWQSNACYDPKRARMMPEMLVAGGFLGAPINQTIANTLYGQRFCEQEINMLALADKQAALADASTSAPPLTPSGQSSMGRLTSEHLLIIIIVCSCLGFLILLGILGLIASKVCNGGHAAPTAAGASATPGSLGSVYQVYENPVGMGQAEKTKF